MKRSGIMAGLQQERKQTTLFKPLGVKPALVSEKTVLLPTTNTWFISMFDQWKDHQIIPGLDLNIGAIRANGFLVRDAAGLLKTAGTKLTCQKKLKDMFVDADGNDWYLIFNELMDWCPLKQQFSGLLELMYIRKGKRKTIECSCPLPRTYMFDDPVDEPTDEEWVETAVFNVNEPKEEKKYNELKDFWFTDPFVCRSEWKHCILRRVTTPFNRFNRYCFQYGNAHWWSSSVAVRMRILVQKPLSMSELAPNHLDWRWNNEIDLFQKAGFLTEKNMNIIKID
ncbi:MAG: hypothetical protein [Cressdnaviricota sp.]|nr:MAG: hypothetical protein [Cressdnaviricota sp.]